MIFAVARARYDDRHCRKRLKGQAMSASQGCLNRQPTVYQLALSKRLSPSSDVVYTLTGGLGADCLSVVREDFHNGPTEKCSLIDINS